jgi:hypothetical protein
MKKHNLRRSTLAPGLCSLLVACAGAHNPSGAQGQSGAPAGTETDNPVVATSSPADFTTPLQTPPCVGPSPDGKPTLPDALPRSALIATARGSVLAVADGGLTLLDVSDPAHPLTLSEHSVRGTVSELLVSASGQLWVSATEAPEVNSSGVPSVEELAAHPRLIVFDVSDPTAPVRLAEAESGGGWLHERGDQIWTLTPRLVAEALRCDAPRYFCSGPGYEAVTLRGFRLNGGTLEPVSEAELPFFRRVWWNGDGVVTTPEDSTLQVLSWDDAGVPRAPRVVSLPEGGAVAGPVQVTGNELSVVSVADGRAALHVYDLASSSTVPARSFALGDAPSDGRPMSTFSLFSHGYLWLQRFEPEARAQLWEVSGATPVKIEVPGQFTTVLPLEGVTRDGQSDELLAFGVTLDDSASLLSLRGTQVSVLGPAPAGAEYLPYSNRGNPIPAPANLHGVGSVPGWNLFSRGPGLPIGIDPAPPPASGWSDVQTSTAIERPGAEPAQASFVYDYDVSGAQRGTALQPNPRLQVTSNGNTTNLELSPGVSTLIPIPQGVLALAPEPPQCKLCTAVQVFDLSSTPQLRATLPFPELPLPIPASPNQLQVSWENYDNLSGLLRTGLKLDARRIAFVAQVELSCNTPEDCDALGLEAVPIGQANVVPSSYVDCPPGADAGCVPHQVSLSVYGSGQRQYFYVLDLDAEGGPAWQAWGTSSLEATAARSDDGSRFAAAFATQGTLAATRLERHDPSGSLASGTYRFMLDRFEQSASGDVIALPAVNVPGYPVAKLDETASSERWISIEPAPGATGRALLHRLDLRSDGAHIEQTQPLDAGTLAGFQPLQIGDRWFGLVLTSPSNACGNTQLSAIELGSAAGNASEPLAIRSTLELPADAWTLVATDQNRALLRHDQVYTLVELASDGTLSVVSSRSSDVRLDNDSLVGKTLFGAARRSGTRRIDF